MTTSAVIASYTTPWDTTRIRFDLHGSLCGKVGPEPCTKTRTITGKALSLED